MPQLTSIKDIAIAMSKSKSTDIHPETPERDYFTWQEFWQFPEVKEILARNSRSL